MSEQDNAPRRPTLEDLMAVEEGTASPLQTLETLGLVLSSGLVHSLQGFWGRAVRDAIEGGLIDADGNVTDYAIEALGDIEESDEF